MSRMKCINLALLAAACSFGLVTITFADDNGQWKIEITPRYTVDQETKQSVRPLRQTTVFQMAQAEQLAVPEPEAEAAPDADASANQGNLPIITPAYSPANNGAASYRQVFNSIPYSRAQYVANPSYRHEATMSILLGQPYVTNGPKDIIDPVPDAVKMSPWSKTTPWFHSGGNLLPYPGANYGFVPYWP